MRAAALVLAVNLPLLTAWSTPAWSTRHVALVGQPRRSATVLAMADAPVEVDDEEWTTTASGLQYLDVSVGSGESPSQGDVVKVEYTGWLESSGKQFDASAGRPIAFAVGTGRVIPGWDEGILSMKVGGKRRLSIPSELAYGEDGAGADIPGGARLQFMCELVSIEKGVSAVLSTFPGGPVNAVLASVLLLSFIPYFLPEGVRPDMWK